jgi:hypothetical protein
MGRESRRKPIGIHRNSSRNPLIVAGVAGRSRLEPSSHVVSGFPSSRAWRCRWGPRVSRPALSSRPSSVQIRGTGCVGCPLLIRRTSLPTWKYRSCQPRKTSGCPTVVIPPSVRLLTPGRRASHATAYPDYVCPFPIGNEPMRYSKVWSPKLQTNGLQPLTAFSLRRWNRAFQTRSSLSPRCYSSAKTDFAVAQRPAGPAPASCAVRA